MFALSRRFVVCLVVLIGSGAAPAFGGNSPESAAREFLALAYDGRFDELAKAPAARTERFERQVRNVLRVRCIRADRIAFSVVEERPEQVVLHADVAMEKRDPRGSGAWSDVEIVPLRLELTREGETWRIAAVQNRDEVLAERLLQAAAEERERLLREQPERLSRGLSRALYARSLAILNTGDFKEGVEAAALARRVAVEAGDRGGEALALGVAALRAKAGELERLSRESLAIAETTGDPDVLARAWYDFGRAGVLTRYERSLRTSDIIECYQKARRIAERAEDPTILIRALYSLANIAANEQSDYLRARRLIDEGLSVAREVGDVTGEMGLEMVLSTVYSKQRDWERGLAHLVRATDLAEKTQAFAYSTMLAARGGLLVEQRRYDEARVVYDRIVDRNETGVTTKIQSMPGRHLGSVLRGMAQIEANGGNFAEAECLVREAAGLDGRHPDTHLWELAPHYADRGNDAGALALALASLFQDELRLNIKAGQRAEALLAASRSYRGLGFVDSALANVLEAIEIREDLDPRYAGDEQQLAKAAEATTEYYELAAELTLGRGGPVEALTLLERSRARVLTSILENGRPGAMEEADDAVREQEAALDREVARITAELDRAQSGGDKTIGDYQEQLSRARDARATLLDGVRARSEMRNAVRRRVDADEILALAAKLPPGMVAVEYLAGDRDLYIFVASGNGVTVRTSRVGKGALGERVSIFLERLASSDLRVEALGRELYSLLIEPIESDIAGADGLLVVPDDGLWRIPFAALVDRRGRFLVESKAIVYAPSLIAYASVADAHKRRGAGKRSESTQVALLAIANPTLDPLARQVAVSFYRNWAG